MIERYIEFDLENGQRITVQTIEPEGTGTRPAARGDQTVIDRASQKLSEALGPIRATADSLFKAFEGAARMPDEVQVEFAVKLSAGAGVILASSSVEGNFKISVKWTKR